MLQKLWSRYGPATAAVFIAALTAASSALTDHHIDAGEGVQIAIALTTAVSVWYVPLLPGVRGAKTVVAGILAVLNAATAYVVGGLDMGEIINLAIAGLGVVLVGVAPVESVGDTLVPRSVAAAMNRQAYRQS
ncbi:hypothetical protein [Dactylosporangium salmoneum]|uniref:Holin n=1 Tax=Dactylosporangium salmoneum TaxID=53361 RepID=A0ABN3FDK9_9ACTN